MTGDAVPRAAGWPPDGLVEDYDALRHRVGAVALERDVVRVAGPDAVEYLQGQCSQDIAALAVGSSADALLLTPQGKLDALVRVTRAGEDEMYVDVDGGFGAAVVARLARFKLRVRADITALEWRCVALRGPDAAVAAADAVTTTTTTTTTTTDVDGPAPAGTGVVASFECNGVVGVDLLGDAARWPSLVRVCGAESWQSLRVEAGIPVMGAELDGRTIAAEAGLLERCVSFTKGCYTGQELVARLDARGNKVARRLRGLVIDRPDAPGPTIGPGAEVAVGERVVGRVTSVAWSPAFRAPVGLAYLHRDVEPPCRVDLRAGADADGDAGADGDADADGAVTVVGAEARALPLVG